MITQHNLIGFILPFHWTCSKNKEPRENGIFRVPLGPSWYVPYHITTYMNVCVRACVCVFVFVCMYVCLYISQFEVVEIAEGNNHY